MELFSEDSILDIYVEKLESREGFTGLKVDLIQECLVDSGKFYEVSTSLADQAVKCRHRETKIECEIRMNSKLPVCNSRLIQYYLTLDPKLRPLFFVIKAWAESQQLKKVSFFSNYSIYILIIFYLQQEPYKIPPVSELQRNAPPEFIGDWNGAFIPIQFTSPALKNATLKDLVLGFFKFYSSFDYFSYVIAPFFGSIINKLCFLKPYDLPPCYENFISANHLMFMEFGTWVQDPFCHSKNITAAVNLISMGRFAALCRSALQLETPNEKQLLCRLILQCQNGSLVDYRGVEIEKGEMWDELHWIQIVRNVLFVIVTNILCCNILQVQQKRLNEGTRTINIANKLRTGKVDQIVLNCMGMRNIWDGRIHILKMWQDQISRDSTCFDVDVFVSNLIRNDVRRVATYDLCVEMTFIRDPTSVRIAVYGANKLHFTHYFYTRMLKALEAAELKEQICNQFNVDSTGSKFD